MDSKFLVSGRVVRHWNVDTSIARLIAIVSTYERPGMTSNQDVIVNALARQADGVIVVSAGEYKSGVDLPGNAMVIERQNVGHDWASYKAGLDYLGPNIPKQGVLFVNESFFVHNPIKFSKLVKRASETRFLVAGVTESFQVSRHLQSYLFFLGSAFLKMDPVIKFWQDIGFRTKSSVILRYEVGMGKLVENTIGWDAAEAIYQASLAYRLLSRVRLLTLGKFKYKPLAVSAVNPTLLYHRQISSMFGITKFEAANQSPYFAMRRLPSKEDSFSQGLLRFRAAGSQIAVILHCHSLDGLSEVLALTAGRNFDFYLTGSNLDVLDDARREIQNSGNQVVVGYVTDNRGRDTLPFIKLIAEIGNEMPHEIFFKIHLKRSTHSVHGKYWARRLYGGLLEQENLKVHIDFLRKPGVGMSVGAEEVVSKPIYDGGNDQGIQLISEIARLESLPKPYVFAAGSMFAYSASYHQLLKELSPKLLSLVWEGESGQLDGTLAHALERMWLYLSWASELGVQAVKRGSSLKIEESLWIQNYVPTVEI